MSSKIDKWADRLQKEGLVDFAIGHLQKNNVALPADNRLRSAGRMPGREQLVEMVLGLQGSDAGKLRYRLLLESVRQERARRSRKKEQRLIKRLDLKESTCSKLAALSRATKRNESRLVEDLIAEEAAIRRKESATLKEQRNEISEDRRGLRQKQDELEQARYELSRREKSLAVRLGRLTAFENLLKTIIECEVGELKVRIDVDQGGSIERLIESPFSASSIESVKPIGDAWNEFLDHFGEGDHGD